jgi:hypothetical protein
MLHSRGAETQKNRRKSIDLDVIYSNDPDDLGNIEDYDEFIEHLVDYLRGIKTIPEAAGLPYDHCQEYQKRGQDLPACVGSCGLLSTVTN